MLQWHDTEWFREEGGALLPGSAWKPAKLWHHEEGGV